MPLDRVRGPWKDAYPLLYGCANGIQEDKFNVISHGIFYVLRNTSIQWDEMGTRFWECLWGGKRKDGLWASSSGFSRMESRFFSSSLLLPGGGGDFERFR